MPKPAGDAPTCGNHQTPCVWKEGISKKTNREYAFWGWDFKMPNGDWCDYKPVAAGSKEDVWNQMRDTLKAILEELRLQRL